MHKNIPYKTARINGLPDDKHTMFETCRRHQELNSNINFKKYAFFWFKLHKTN